LTDQQDDHGVQAITTLLDVLKPMDDATRINVLQFVFKALNFTMPGAAPVAPAYNPPPPGAPAHTPPPAHHAHAPPPGSVTDLRSLKEQKQPKTANQMVAVRHTESKLTARGFGTVSNSPSPRDTAISSGACH
jgi:hypothetical protein